MIELQNDELAFTFPKVHPEALLRLSFKLTLRIPDDGKDHPLPPDLGNFPLRHVDDHPLTVSPEWIRHGGVMLPMHQAEAMWLAFDGERIARHATEYPFAIKIATGKINAVSGGRWSEKLHRRPRQDYLVVPKQPWLDGYCVGEGVIRQFVAMPLGSGYTAEEQITGDAAWGGLQILVMPMKREVFERRFPIGYELPERPATMYVTESAAEYGPMGLAPGGRMRQEIAADPFSLADWDLEAGSRVFVHLANSMDWHRITGEAPPATPVTAAAYTAAGLPWFAWYDENTTPVGGSPELAALKSVAAIGRRRRRKPLPENEPVTPEKIIALRRGLCDSQVRESSGNNHKRR